MTTPITYVNDLPDVPGHLRTDAPHVHHRESDTCLRVPDGEHCPTPAELRAEVERLHRLVGASTTWTREAYAARDALAQAAWDAMTALGQDTDGDTTPAALIAGMGHQGLARVLVQFAGQARLDYDESLEESTKLEAERDALQQRAAKLQALAEGAGPGSCGGLRRDSEGCHVRDLVLDLRAALGGPAAPTRWDALTLAQKVMDAARRATPTPEPTITGYDGSGAPIMDHAREPQPEGHEAHCPHPAEACVCGGM